jgi:hypothetical protein
MSRAPLTNTEKILIALICIVFGPFLIGITIIAMVAIVTSIIAAHKLKNNQKIISQQSTANSQHN